MAEKTVEIRLDIGAVSGDVSQDSRQRALDLGARITMLFDDSDATQSERWAALAVAKALVDVGNASLMMASEPHPV